MQAAAVCQVLFLYYIYVKTLRILKLYSIMRFPKTIPPLLYFLSMNLMRFLRLSDAIQFNLNSSFATQNQAYQSKRWEWCTVLTLSGCIVVRTASVVSEAAVSKSSRGTRARHEARAMDSDSRLMSSGGSLECSESSHWTQQYKYQTLQIALNKTILSIYKTCLQRLTKSTMNLQMI